MGRDCLIRWQTIYKWELNYFRRDMALSYRNYSRPAYNMQLIWLMCNGFGLTNARSNIINIQILAMIMIR